MAPRTAKAKKTADVKVAENEVSKKGKGKGKIVEDPEPEIIDDENSEKAQSVVDKKTKRGKKVINNTNEDEQVNGMVEESAPVAKKGRKKNVESQPQEENSAEDESSSLPEELDQNGDTEEIQTVSTGRGRKKQTKTEVEKKDAGRGRKNAKTEEVTEKGDASEAKPKPVGKGRGRKAQVKDVDQDAEENVETVEEKAVTKSRKKGAKIVKEKTPESEKDESPKHEDDDEEEAVEEPKKKGKKNQKKVKEVEDKDEAPASKKRKVNKKEDKGKGDAKDDDEEVMEDLPETKTTKGKRGAKKAVESPAGDEEPQDTGEPTTKRRRKAADDKAPVDDPKRKAPPKNKATTNYSDIDFSNSSKNSIGKEWNIKIASWNVDGIRAWLNKGGMEYIKSEKPDILCLQETKCSQDKLPDEIANLPGYHAYWLCSEKDGYAGVGIYTTKLAMSVQYGLQNNELDAEGRIITAEYEQFYLICTYVPNAGRKLVTLPKRLQWNEEFRKYVKELDKKKPVIICGDMNVAHNEIDLANPKTNKKNAGFTEEERAGMTDLLGDGFVDTFRHLNPDKTGAYTFWTYMSNSRSKNVGWRLDYFIMSERLLPSLCDNVIRDQVYGSDHCPITLYLHLSTADKPKE